MMITKVDALQSLRPGAEWVLRGDKLEWRDSTKTQPTEEQIEAKIVELQAAEPMRQLRINATNYSLNPIGWQ